MLSRGTIESYAAGVDSISDAAAGYVRGVLERAWAQGLEVAEMRELAIETLMAAADQYGGMTRELACTLYEEQTGQAAKVPAQSRVSREFVEDFARYNAGKLVDGDIGGFAKACADRASYFARRDVNETVISSCKKQKATGHRKRYRHGGGGKGTRFARVPQGGDTCTFCAMLASRGFVYWTRKTAGEFNHYHANCRCLVVPDDGSGEVEGYDPDEWLRRWRDYEEIDARDDLTRAEKDHEKRIYPYIQNAVGAVYSRLYAERDLEVANCDFKLKQNQLIHVEGSAQNRIAATGRGIEPSCFTMDEKEILELIKQYAGHGTPDDSRNDGEWSRKEICTADKVVGYVVNRKGERIPTRCFKIHYADNGVHAVPRYDDGGEPNDISR